MSLVLPNVGQCILQLPRQFLIAMLVNTQNCLIFVRTRIKTDIRAKKIDHHRLTLSMSEEDKKISDFCSGWVQQHHQQHHQQQQPLQYSRSLSSKSPVTKEHILQIIVKGLKNKTDESQETVLRSDVNTPTTSVDRTSTTIDDVERTTTKHDDVDRTTANDGEVDRSTSNDEVDRTTNNDEVDSDNDGSEGSQHKKFGLIRYRSLRDHNGRYYLVVKIR